MLLLLMKQTYPSFFLKIKTFHPQQRKTIILRLNLGARGNEDQHFCKHFDYI